MGKARWAKVGLPGFLQGWIEKLLARIKLGPIGLARINTQPIRVRVGLA